MKNINSITEINNITHQAKAQFFLEDKLERDYALGLICEEEYKEGLQGIFRNFKTLYGFQIPTEYRGQCPLCLSVSADTDEFKRTKQKFKLK